MGSLISQNISYSGVTLSQQSIPVGMIIPTSGTTVPSGYLKCDGTVYSISLYPHLAAFYESEFGACNRYGGDGTTTFAVPDLCGEFIRGAGTNSHANQGSGGNPGEHQDGTEIPTVFGFSDSRIYAGLFAGSNKDKVMSVDNRVYSQTGTIQTLGEKYTSRPTNTSVLYIIKAKPDRLDKITFAEVDDTSTADDVVWSAEKISGEISRITEYSTAEKVVGKWIDGKKIYQKVIDFGALPNATTKEVSHGITYSRIIKVYGYAYQSTYKVTLPIPYVSESNASIRLGINDTKIMIASTIDFSAYTECYITLQYTKTTT